MLNPASLRLALRSLAARPVLALATWLSLVLGLGAVIILTTLVEGLLLNPLPFADSERIVLVWESDVLLRQRKMGAASAATFADLRAEQLSLTELCALTPATFGLTSVEPPSAQFGRRVTANYFAFFGVEPFLGRSFTPEEERDDHRVVILAKGLWQQSFGSDPTIVGRTIELDRRAHVVVGVAEFRGPFEPSEVRLWVPLAPDHERRTRAVRNLAVYARLAPGAALETAQRQLDELLVELRRRDPAVMEQRAFEVRFLSEMLIGEFRPALRTLLAASALLLVIVCANVAHLLLIRTVARGRELAIRTALGASRRRLLSQLALENTLLAVSAAALAVALAPLGINLLTALVPVRFDLPRLDHIAVDWGTVAFATGLALIAGLAFGLPPLRLALAAGGPGRDLAATSGRSTTTRKRRLFRRALVVSEIALVVLLLVATSLTYTTFRNLKARRVADRPENILVLRTSLRGESYGAAATRVDFFRRAEEELLSLPGVVAVGSTDLIPLVPNPRGEERFVVAGASRPAPGEEPLTLVQVVTPGYFATLGTALLEGRMFTAQDEAAAPPVALVNARFAAAYLRGRPRLESEVSLVAGGERRRVVGVVADARFHQHPPDPVPTLYLPHTQRPANIMTFVLRTAVAPETLARPAEATLAKLDPLLPTFNVTTLVRAEREADWRTRMSLVLLVLLAAVTCTLALTGIYAVLATSVAERRAELAIRASFGATPADLWRLVFSEGLALTLLGLGLGLALAAALSRWLASQLYGVSGTDAAIYATIALLVAVAVAAACLVPARRAMRIDPATCLKEEAS